MRSYNHGRLQQQASFLRRQFLQDGDLPFMDVLSEGIVAQALTAIDVVWLDGICSPLVTLWVFLGQALSADHSCRAVLNLGFCRYAGKGHGEVSLLRRLWDVHRPGDVLLTDSLLSNWTGILLLKERGVHSVSRLNKALRKADFRRGRRLGHDDHIVRWHKPTSIRSVDWSTYKSLPEWLTIREARFRVEQPGFRTKAIVVVTTLLDPAETTKEDLACLYRDRWNNELYLRSIKSTMQMDVLRCKTADLVHKEVWTHIFAYNLIRTIMAQAATRHSVEPCTISFKGTLQTLEAFRPLLDFQERSDTAFRAVLYEQLLDAIALHRVANRPDRFEPRYRKRRSKRYAELKLLRHEAKLAILKGVSKN